MLAMSLLESAVELGDNCRPAVHRVTCMFLQPWMNHLCAAQYFSRHLSIQAGVSTACAVMQP